MTEEDINDTLTTVYRKAQSTLKCHYLKRVKEGESFIYFKSIKETVTSAGVLSITLVKMTSDMPMVVSEYQFISDCI